MKNYERMKKYTNENFKRLVWVRKETFEEMLKFLREEEKKKNAEWWAPNKLILETRLLMLLEYLREYRTYAHIWEDYGVSESTCYRNCIWIEKTLLKNKKLRIPWKKELKKGENEIEVILIDASETPIERPKKKEEEEGK
jgi:hypothetical protein